MDAIDKQNAAFDKILNPVNIETDENDQRITKVSVNRQEKVQVSKTFVQPPVVDDPIIAMFKNVKRKVDFHTYITLSEKIPRLEFIELMEDSYNISIIDFLADEFTNKILNDPSIIREMIKSEITKKVYPGELEGIEGNSGPGPCPTGINDENETKEETIYEDTIYEAIIEEEIIEEKVEEKEEETIEEEILKKAVKITPVKERVKIVTAMKSVLEISEYIKKEKAQSVLEAASERIKELQFF
jgi:hypothetical protein